MVLPRSEIQTKILIEALPEKVWETLLNFDLYPEWNPFIIAISGKPDLNGKIRVTAQPPGGKPMTFNPAILVCDPNHELRWKGKLGMGGIFDGEHYFILHTVGEVGTSLIHGERFRGILVPFLKGALNKTRVGFELMNNALKKQCEAS